MYKKAQAAVFLIVAVILLVVVGMSSMLKEKVPESEAAAISTDPISLYVESCLKDTLEQGIYFISSQGGYNRPAHAQEFEGKEVAFYLDGSEFSVPTLYTFEQELSSYVGEHLPECIDHFRGFLSAGYQIEAKEPSLRARVGENDITAFVTYPITVQQGNAKKEVDEFSVSVPFDFKDVYKILQDIMIQQGDDPLAVHYGFLAESAYYNDYYFYIVQMEDGNTIVYQLQFDSKTLDGKPYTFNFAARYDW